jgi:excinuclease ABC subunit C
MSGDKMHASSLKEQVMALPHEAGVYLFKDAKGTILYVGKAKDLRKRVSSYIKEELTIKTRRLMDRTREISFLVTPSEKDALLLENNLIKEHRPRYNVSLRDDKDYPSLKLSIEEEYPRFQIVRRPKPDKSMYFGPFSSAGAVRQTLRIMQRLFPLRRCKGPVGKSKRPCLNYQMGRCLGPCWSKISPEEYGKVVQEAVYFLQGRCRELERMLKSEMGRAAEDLDFERAARLRDRLQAVHRTLEKQHVVHWNLKDVDALGIFSGEEETTMVVVMLRGGFLVGSRSFVLDHGRTFSDDLITDFIKRFYHEHHFVPSEILLPQPVAEKELLEQWLSEQKGGAVSLTVPQRGAKKDLVKLAQENAAKVHQTRVSTEKQGMFLLEEMKAAFHLKRLPVDIECYDISTLMGHHSVGSRVTFRSGEPYANGYRRYKVEEKGYPDDYAMMHEVLTRRFKRLEEEPSPDLIIMDGGKGQLNVALSVLDDFGLDVEVIGLAKEGFDKVYLPGRKNPVLLKPDSKVLHLLQRIRDESHRFALRYHRLLRKKTGLLSDIDRIPGVGPRRKNVLLKYFGSVEALKEAGIEDLAAVEGISMSLARTIFDFFRGEENQARHGDQ